MKHSFLILILFFVLTNYSYSNNIVEEINELESQNNNSNLNTPVLDSVLSKTAIEFMNTVIANSFDAYWRMVDQDLKTEEEKDIYQKWFSLSEKCYGKITNAKLKNLKFDESEGYSDILATYSVNFDTKYRGTIMVHFRNYGTNILYTRGINSIVEDYTNIRFIESLASNAIKAIISNKYNELFIMQKYDYYPVESFDTFMTRMSGLTEQKIDTIQMFRNQVGIRNGFENIFVFYEVNKIGILTLMFKNEDNHYVIEYIGYKKK